ncbi:MAG TPA: hypothetical protein VMU64_03975 [Acidimicrobiales bacterium]|nr:hypothetical protein [Acidimicrobiales bacterium]
MSVGSVPAAQQSAVDTHETAASGPVPLGSAWVLHVVPPLVVTSTTPFK